MHLRYLGPFYYYYYYIPIILSYHTLSHSPSHSHYRSHPPPLLSLLSPYPLPHLSACYQPSLQKPAQIYSLEVYHM